MSQPPAGLPRALELARLWSNPFRWQQLTRELADLAAFRQERHEAAATVGGLAAAEYDADRSGDVYERLRWINAAVAADPVVSHCRDEAEACARRATALDAELRELHAHVETHAPHLLGRLPASVSVDDARSREHSQAVYDVLGQLLACSTDPKGAAGGAAGGASIPDRFAAVRRWAARDLKGDALAVVEALCDHNGGDPAGRVRTRRGAGVERRPRGEREEVRGRGAKGSGGQEAGV